MRPVSRLASCSMRKACAFLRPPRACLARTIRFDCIAWDAWRPGETISDLLAATWVCAQAASEAAPRITASHCTTLRSPEPELKGAPMQIALMSTYEVLAQLLENISSPAYRIRHARVAIQSGRNEVRRELLRHHSRDFMSVLSLSHIWRWRSAICDDRINGHERSSWPLAGSTCVAISRLVEPHIAARQKGFRPFPGTVKKRLAVPL